VGRALALAVCCLAAVFWWHNFVSSGRCLAQLDAHPHRRGTATALFYFARYYEIFNKNDVALEHYKRIVERYPRSRYGMEAQYGVAASYEKMKRFHDAIVEYEKFLEDYPDNKYTVSVRNNVEILKSR